MHNLLELIKKEQNIYNTVFHEVIRQVRVANVHKTSMLLYLHVFKKWKTNSGYLLRFTSTCYNEMPIFHTCICTFYSLVNKHFKG